MKKKFYLIIPAICLLMMIMGGGASADTIILFQGSVMVGKIISEDKSAIVLAASYGKFRIRRIKIDDIYKTNSYQEDIELHRRLKLECNEDVIRRNYAAGQDVLDGTSPPIFQGGAAKEEFAPAEKETKKPGTDVPRDDHWRSGRLSFSGSGHYNLGSSNNLLPFGYAGYFAFDQGLDFTSGGRKPGIPGLRVEGGYLYFQNGAFSITGIIAGVGLMWALPSMKNSRGCVIIAVLPGAVSMTAKTSGLFPGQGSSTSAGVNFAAQALLGYQKSWGVFSIFIQARYMYIYAPGSYFHSIGGEAGFGFNAW